MVSLKSFYVFVFVDAAGNKVSHISNTEGVLMIGDAAAAEMGFKPPTATPDGAAVRRMPRGGVLFSVHHMKDKRALVADDGRVWQLITKKMTPFFRNKTGGYKLD